MFESTFSAMKFRTSSGMFSLSASLFDLKIAILVSTSGGCISATMPLLNLDVILSSKLVKSLGGRSDVITICFPAMYNALKVWKNSSWVDSLPMINWTSSISKTSAFLNFSLNWFAVYLPFPFPLWIVSISSLVKASPVV